MSPAEEQKLKEANDFITNEANVKAYTEVLDKWNEKCDALNLVKIPGEAATGNSPQALAAHTEWLTKKQNLQQACTHGVEFLDCIRSQKSI